MKKLSCFLLALLMILSVLTACKDDSGESSEDTGSETVGINSGSDESVTSQYIPTEEETAHTEGLVFKLSDDGSYYIVTKYEGTEPDVVIPKYFNNLPVTAIGSDGVKELPFYNNEIVKSVTIPDSINYIYKNSFLFCINLEAVHISDIAAWCNIEFYNNGANPMGALYQTEFEGERPNAKLYINGELLENLVIPETVTKISDNAFFYCESLKSITIPESVTEIGKDAFCCSGLSGEVIIPESVTVIGSHAFSGCENLSLNQHENLYYLGNEANPYHALVGADVIEGFTYNIHEDTKVIGGKLFSGNSRLHNIVIPDSVVSICDGVFNDCYNLESVKMPDSVLYIGEEAFAYCDALEEFNLSNSVKEVGDSAFLASTAEISKLPESLINIGESAFSGAIDAEELVIPESVTYIGAKAFNSNYELKTVKILPENVVLGEEVFLNCFALENIYCASPSQPQSWSTEWIDEFCTATVTWGSKG